MKSNKVALCALALSTVVGIGAAFGEAFSDGTSAASGKTRQEVKAELAQARAAGQLFTGDLMQTGSVWNGVELGAQGAAGSRYSGKTRQEVKDELVQAISEGFKMSTGELGYPDISNRSSTSNPVSLRSRQDVRQEAIDFFKSHPTASLID